MRIRHYLFILFMAAAVKAQSYSVLTHEAIVDAAWETAIKPRLLSYYPNATPEQLKEAHAYCYGGAIMPDMGYYPLGSKLFTNLVHYVRSGDFVAALVHESSSLNELAFSLGALAHYYADIEGHPYGTNLAVPLVFPEVKQKYGSFVNFAQHPMSHKRTELGFDIVQVAKGNYAPEAYHDFIGFKLSPELMERAFFQIYGMSLRDIFPNFNAAINAFRWAVKSLVPEITKAAWINKKEEIMKSRPGITEQQFRYRMNRASFHKEWGSTYEKLSFRERTLALFIRFIPKIGPFRLLKFKPPTPEGEALFFDSFNRTMAAFSRSVQELKNKEAFSLANMDYDTGKETRAGEYVLADKAYTDLVIQLEKNDFQNTSVHLKENILAFYTNPDVVTIKEKDPEDHEKLMKALEKLKTYKITSNSN